MRHLWYDPRENRPTNISSEVRRCWLCGRTQEKVDEGMWLRRDMRWRPRVGRCKPRLWIYRVRVTIGRPARPYRRLHADVVAHLWQDAMKAAKRHWIDNWRHVDTFDEAPDEFEEFEYLYKLGYDEAKRPEIPRRLFTEADNLKALEHL